MAIEAKTVTLTSDGAGDATGSVLVSGVIRGVEVVSITTPTDQWDLTVSSPGGVAILTDTGIGSAAAELIIPTQAGTAGANGQLFGLSGNLSLVGANMGASKSAKVIIYVEK